MLDASQHPTMDELKAALPDILSAPKDDGRLDLIVVRPARGERETPESVRISLAGGVDGDHWAKGTWMETDDGQPHPDVQICMMPSAVIRAISADPATWPSAGDNLFLDMDLSPSNLPPGTRVALGSAEMVITEVPHNGCQNFIDRYGRDACLFVNTGPGKEMRFRGIYARVTKDGEVSVGDRLRKLAD